MYTAPTRADFDRHMSDLVHKTRHSATSERDAVCAAYAKRGIAPGPLLASAIAERIETVFLDSLACAVDVMGDYSERLRQPPADMIQWAQPHLERLTGELLLLIDFAPIPARDRINYQKQAVFASRLRGALRDFEIGFSGGRSIVKQLEESSEKKALRILRVIYDRTRNTSHPIVLTAPPTIEGFSIGEIEAAWHYLKQRGLIETYNMQFSARISAAGIHAIEDAERHPDSTTAAFPNITLHNTYNTVNVNSPSHSPIQQNVGSGAATQSTTYDKPADLEALRNLVEQLAAHLDELDLSIDHKQQVKAQIATISAQLSGKPNAIILGEAGRTIRTLTEGAIGSLIASAVQPAVWSGIHSLMSRIFQ